jgi:hypothetical protein
LGQLIQHGQNRGEIRTDLPAEEIAQVWRQTIFGTLLFWSLIGDHTLSSRIEMSIGLLWDGIGAPGSKTISETIVAAGREQE